MAGKQGAVFLERGTYRRRRMMDAVRLVAILGAGLWMIPVLWPNSATDAGEPVALSRALFFIFGVWLFLIVLSAVLSQRLRGDTSANGSATAQASAEDPP